VLPAYFKSVGMQLPCT